MKTISTSFGKTVNMGNYESARFDASLSIQVKDSANNQEELDDLMDELHQFVESQVKALKEVL